MATIINQEVAKHIILHHCNEDKDFAKIMRNDDFIPYEGMSLDKFLFHVDMDLSETMAPYSDIVGDKIMYAVPLRVINRILVDKGIKPLTRVDVGQASFDHLCELFVRKQVAELN